MSMKSGVVITGGSAGIGLRIVEELLAAGFSVINLARRKVPIASDDIVDIEIDLTDRLALASACEQLAASDARVFIHNAGAIRPDLLGGIDLADLDALNQLHLGAAIQIAEALLPGMKAERFGRIVIISSRASVGMQARSSYAATKAGQIALARTWALELAPCGITVNTVAPGPIEATEMFHEIVPANSAMVEEMAAKIPVQRLGLPADVAQAVMFFIDRDNGFVTGQNLFVCGGTSIGSI
ncbi:MAG: SDR family oxidoreductase [Proteobacteria bacterium]|nr:MAG: SDR family oxidoreductase [Pseudomonadota bacterium]